MRIEIILVFIAIAVMANIYTEGKLIRSLTKYKKYYQMAGVAFAALAIYVLFKKNPDRARDLVFTSNEYLKYMPVDKNATSILTPILDFTSKYSGGAVAGASSFGEFGQAHPILNLSGGSRQSYAESRITKSGVPVISAISANEGGGGRGVPAVKATKRSVSETKKKYVAAQQGWKCGNCHKQLPAWFEVDHKIRLEHGGSNHIDNLVALCRDCHGEKTAIENL